MKNFLAFILSLGILTGQAQTTLTFTQITTSDPDLNRPGGGAEQWTAGQNIVNIPVEGTNTQRLDAYYRFQWIDIQPSNAPSAGNGMDFSKFDAQVNDAINKRQWFSFGIMPNCCSGPTVGGAGLVYPLALHNAMQGESVKDWINGGGWYENPNSPIWLTWFRAMHQALYNHIQTASFMGVPYKTVVKEFDVRIAGDFGEQAVLNAGPAGTTPTSASLINLVDAIVDAYPTLRGKAMMSSFSAGVYGFTPASVGAYELQKTNQTGPLGWRWDSWGWTDGIYHSVLENNSNVVGGFHFDTAIMNRYKYAPIGGEPADLGQAGNFADLPVRVAQYHAKSFGNGNLDQNNPPNATIKNNFRSASMKAGYRITTTGGSMTTSPQTGSTYNVTLNWSNGNGTPPYDTWKVIYEWRDATAVLQRDTAAFVMKGFFTTGTSNETFTMRTVPAGTHDLYMKVVDPTGYQIPMPIFITGRTADGAYLLRSGITVSAGTGVGVANAGPSRTITLPTATASLDGSGSTGTITTYAWTQQSGPNTSSITNANTATATANGLIAGVYVYTLTVNGSSSDTMRVYVNPATPPSTSATTVFTTQVPVTGTQTDGTALELGMKFQSSVAGYITGIRFYKTSGNTGTHVGELYSRTGTRLAQVTFTNETSSGWQTAQLSTPVLITANTTYVVSYFSPSGFYVYTGNYFTTAVVNSPLTGLADGTDGHNGIYIYTGTPAFPTNYSALNNKPNYWVDVVFSLTNPGATPIHKFRSIWFQTANPNP